MNTAASIPFPTSYEESRDLFQDQLPDIQRLWPQARLEQRTISRDEDLSVYWITAEAASSPLRKLVITTGLHGVEGYVGSAMRTQFIQEFLERLDPGTTGILLVHAINPWGMKHYRRVNQANVDLNRNFLETGEDFKEDFNPDYQTFDTALNPRRPLLPFWMETPGMIAKVVYNLLRFGITGLRGAVLLGQNRNPRGLYFSGREYQPECLLLMELFKEAFSAYPAALHIDLHTGYGPRDQMSIVNSPAEERKPQELARLFRYPLIVQANPEQFYSMKGDMVDWVYRYQRSAYPDTRFYGAAFEFGVYGDGIPMEVKSLRTMIFENQAYWQGAYAKATAARIKQDLLEMYHPPEESWRAKALADCRQALEGVLTAEGFIPPA